MNAVICYMSIDALIHAVQRPPEPEKKQQQQQQPAPAQPAIHPDLVDFVGTQFTGAPSEQQQQSQKPAGDLIGFQDDAWAPRDKSSSSPAQPAAQVEQPAPQQQPTMTGNRITNARLQQQIQELQQQQQQKLQQEQQQQIQQQLQQLQRQQEQIQRLLQEQELRQQQQQLQASQMAQQNMTPPPIQQQQPVFSAPPRQRPVSAIKHLADPTLSRWQEQSPQQQHQPTGFMNQQQQQQQFMQPNFTGIQPPYQQQQLHSMATGSMQSPTSFTQSSIPAPQAMMQQQQQFPNQTGFIPSQLTAGRNWQIASK